MDDLVRWYGQQLDEDRSLALLACATGGEPDVLSDGETPIPWQADHAKVFVAGRRSVAETTSPNRAMHIAEHDPARVLREIDAKRQLLADVLAEPHFRNEEDNWYSCAALVDEAGEPVCFDDSRAPGPCDCGRDARVLRRLRLLALPYDDRPGYQESWRP